MIARQHGGLDIATDRNQLLNRHRMVDALDILLDDRTFVEAGGNIVRRCGTKSARSVLPIGYVCLWISAWEEL